LNIVVSLFRFALQRTNFSLQNTNLGGQIANRFRQILDRDIMALIRGPKLALSLGRVILHNLKLSLKLKLARFEITDFNLRVLESLLIAILAPREFVLDRFETLVHTARYFCGDDTLDALCSGQYFCVVEEGLDGILR
jgi:hypothetical protein